MATLLKRVGMGLASRLGFGEEALAAYDSTFGVKSFPVDEGIRTYELAAADREGYVLFPILPGYASWGYIGGILGHAFRTRGYEPIFLRCDEHLDPCPAVTIDEAGGWVEDRCAFYGARLSRLFNVRSHSVDEVLDGEPTVGDGDLSRVRHAGVDVSAPALSSTRKYLKRYHVDLDDPSDGAVYRRFVRSGIKLVDAVGALFDRYDFEATIVYEPCYVHGAIPLAVAADRGASARSVGMGFREGTLLFGNRRNRIAIQEFCDPKTVEESLGDPLTDEQSRLIHRLMTERETGEGVPHHFTPTTEKSIGARTGTTVGVFTNLLWDAALEPEDGPFADVFEWLPATIDRLAGASDVTVVVKTHPAEAVRGTNETVVGWLADAYDDLPPNVELVPPDSDINTYELFDDLDVGVVFNSTVGMEMAFRGQPVVVGGDTHYRGLGITHDPGTPTEYLETLDRVGELECTPWMRDRAERYAYFLLVRKHLDFPYYASSRTEVDYEFLPVRHEEVAPGAEPFDLIVSRILADEPVVAPPDPGWARATTAGRGTGQG